MATPVTSSDTKQAPTKPPVTGAVVAVTTTDAVPQVTPAVTAAAVTLTGTTTTAPSSGVATLAVGGQAFTGAINLTISNGAINIKPATPGQNVKGQTMLAGATPVTLTSTTPVALMKGGPAAGKLPVMQPGQTVNLPLRIPNPTAFNIRMAKPGTAVMAPRGSLMMRPGTAQVVGQMAPGGQAQMITQAGMLPQGARLITHQIAGMNAQALMARMPNFKPGISGVVTSKGFTSPTGQPISSLSSLTLPIQMAVPATAVPAQGTLPVGVTSMPATFVTTTLSGAFPGLAGTTLTVTPLASPPVQGPQPLTVNNQPISLPIAVQSLPMAATQVAAGAVPPAAVAAPSSQVVAPVTTLTVPVSSTPANTATTTAATGSSSTTTASTTSITVTPSTSSSSVGDKSSSQTKEDDGANKKPNKGEEGSEDVKKEIDSDFDPVKAMDWEDGIGALPGSNLKFRINEFGMMEVVDDDKAEPASGSEEEKTEVKEEGQSAGGSTAGDDKDVLKDEICRCENCGMYGLAGEFCDNGRFCQKSCMANFASKSPTKKALQEKGLLGMGRLLSQTGPNKLGMKKKKRRLLNGDERDDAKSMRLGDEDEDSKRVLMGKKKGFSWVNYLESEGKVSATAKLFKDPFPSSKNGFRVGMKFEAIDPKHPSLYCVVTVAEVRGYRIRCHFDGYSECYDFWTNADSPFNFPVGWCDKNGKKLQFPKGFTDESFNWTNYLQLSKAQAAPKHLFTNTSSTSVTPHGFRIGMKLEAVDKKNTSLTCVATVADVLGDRILIHFDGWEDSYDYWCDPSSQYIHPVGWCQENGKPLSPPNDWKDIAGFTWEEYLSTTKSSPVPARAFKNRPAHGFEVGMMLEAVDKRNPILIRVATVAAIEPYRFLLHFDGWSDVYDYWVDDDCVDIHPPGWCAKTGHPLTPPISIKDLANSPSQGGCPTPGCNGIGHIKGAKYTGHHSAFGCPYSQLNMNKESALQERLGPTKSEFDLQSHQKTSVKTENITMDLKNLKCPTPGCDSSGHITGKYTSHHKVSGCPLVESNHADSPTPPVTTTTTISGKLKITAPLVNGDKPLFGPGSGRGRKKHKLIKAHFEEYQEYKALKEGRRSSYNPYLALEAAESNTTPGGGSSLHQGIHQSVFMSAFVTSPTKDMPLCWEQHAKLLPGLDKISGSEVTDWTMHDVAGFVKSLPGCGDIGKLFLEEQIDGEAFMLLSQADIVKIMNVKLGPAIKIYNSILMFKNSVEV